MKTPNIGEIKAPGLVDMTRLAGKLLICLALFLALGLSATFSLASDGGANVLSPADASDIRVAFVYSDGVLIFYSGKLDGISVGMKFEAWRGGVRVGEVKILEVWPHVSYARPEQPGLDVREGDILRRAGAPALSKSPAKPSGRAAASAKKEAPQSIWPPSGKAAEEIEPASVSASASSAIKIDRSMQERMREKKLKVELRGYRYLKYRTYGSSGDSTSFLSRNGLITYGSRIEQGTDLDVKASLRDRYALEGHFFELPNQERTIMFGLAVGDHYKLKMGDFTSTFRSGSLSGINKSVTGAQISYDTAKTGIDLIMSQSKSNTKTVTFNGNNTHGPYNLQAVEVVPGSEQVLLNGQTLSKDLYTIDYYLGLISFCTTEAPPSCRTITSSDDVQVIYEQKLLLSLSAGDLMGFSAAYKFGQAGDNRVGAAFMKQQANRSATLVKKQNIFVPEAANFSADGFTLTLPPVPSNSRVAPLVLLEKPFDAFGSVQRSGRLLTYGQDYVIDTSQTDENTGYAYGRLRFTTPALTPVDISSIVVNYNAYDGSLAQQFDECLLRNSGDDTRMFLQHQTVYSGAETVQQCFDTPDNVSCRDQCDTRGLPALTRGRDYVVDEISNSILCGPDLSNCPNQQLRRQWKITYVTVPEAAQQSSQYDHTVVNAFSNLKAGPLNFQLEWARSQADVSNTPIQVLKEPVVIATGTLVCGSSAGAGLNPCVFSLRNTRVVPDSLQVTPSFSDTPLRQYSEFRIDGDTGRLALFNITLATGTVVYANYQFNPAFQAGVVPGVARRIKMNTNLKNVSVDLRRDDTDTLFTPIGGNNTLETGRTQIHLGTVLPGNVTVGTGWSKFETAQDILGMFKTQNRQRTLNLSYGGDKGNALTLALQKDQAADNRDPSITNTSRSSRQFGLDFQPKRIKNLKFGLQNTDVNFTDNTGISDSTREAQRRFNMQYKPTDNLDFSGSLEQGTIRSDGPGGSSTVKTATRIITANYVPVDVVTLTADINTQRTSDSRPAAGSSSVDTSTVRLTTAPIGRMRSFQLTLTRTDTPSQLTLGSKSQTNTIAATFMLRPDMTLSPNIVNSSNHVGDNSTKSNDRTLTLDYRPQKKRYAVTFSTNRGQTRSTSPQSSQSSSTRRYTLDLGYKFSERTELIYHLDRSRTPGETSSFGTNIDTWTLKHRVAKKLESSLAYGVTRQTGSTSTSERQLTFASDYLVSKILTWNTEYKSNKFTSSQSQQQSNSGHILTSELRLEF